MPNRGSEALTPARLRAQGTVVGLLVVSTALLALGRDQLLGSSLVVLPICMALVLAFNLMAVGFLVARYVGTTDPRVLVLASAYLWSAVLALAILLELPGVASSGPLDADAVGRIGLLFVARQVGLAALIALAFTDRPLDFSALPAVRRPLGVVVLALAGVLAASMAMVGLVSGRTQAFPDVVETVDGSPRVAAAVYVVVLVVQLALLVPAVRGALRHGLHRRLESWVVVTLAAGAAEALLVLLSDDYRSVAAYGGRVLGVVGAVVVVAAMLHETHRLQTRTRGIADQLAAQNHALTEAQGLRDHLVAVVSHDMRSPLAGLLGYLEVLESDPTLSPAEVQRIHARSRLLTRRLIMLTEDLLASATTEGLQVLPQEIDLRRQIDDCVSAFPELSVIVQVPPDLAILADPLRLQQILTNLVRNAQKHGAEPVRIHAVRLEGHRVQVSVSDGGPGVPADFAPRMFDRYTRGPGRATHGAGLGLSVARSLAERHGGSLDYDQAAQVFVLVVPAARQRPNSGLSFARKALTPSAKSGPV